MIKDYNTNSKIWMPDGVAELENIKNELAKFQCHNSDTPHIYRAVNPIIQRVDGAIEMLVYKPRLPFLQIEKKLITMCYDDKSLNGVNLQVLFTTKYSNIDWTRIGQLIIPV